MSSTLRRTLPAILAVVTAAALVAGCGSGKDALPAAAGNVTDRAFVNDMTPHHQSAIAMATIALARGQHPEIKQLAANIISDQKREIVLMTKFKTTLPAGDAKSTLGESMHTMGMGMDTASLRTATRFDEASSTR